MFLGVSSELTVESQDREKITSGGMMNKQTQPLNFLCFNFRVISFNAL